MRFAEFSKQMFRVAFEGERDEVLPLIDYIRFLYAENVAARLHDHPLGPSHVWQDWAKETYVGFSTHRLMLQSGHRFGPSQSTTPPSRLPWRRDPFSADDELKKFTQFYPGFRIPAHHGKLYEAHPAAYLRVSEAAQLSGVKEAGRMLEIGAGNAVHVAWRHLDQPQMHTTVIDLPELICAGYLLLRLMGIDVALPHETRQAAVTMRLPFQSIEGSFDFAFNMSSFQEMDLVTVNRYAALVADHLKPGGTFHHINLVRSKQFPDNRAEDYDLSRFGEKSVQPAPYHSSLDPRNPLISTTARAPMTQTVR